MTDSSSTGGGGGISETISQGVEYLQSAATGLTGQSDGSTDTSTSSDNTAKGSTGSSGVDTGAGAGAGAGAGGSSASEIEDHHVSEFIRDKYKSQSGEGLDQDDQKDS